MPFVKAASVLQIMSCTGIQQMPSRVGQKKWTDGPFGYKTLWFSDVAIGFSDKIVLKIMDKILQMTEF